MPNTTARPVEVTTYGVCTVSQLTANDLLR
jgi:hypothetical protein